MINQNYLEKLLALPLRKDIPIFEDKEFINYMKGKYLVAYQDLSSGWKSRMGIPWWENIFETIRPSFHSREKECIELLLKKHHTYGAGSLIWCGSLGIIVRGIDKIFRLENLLQGVEDKVGERKTDTKMDLFNYTILGFLQERGGLF